MKRFITVCMACIVATTNFLSITQAGNFWTAIEDSAETQPLNQNVDLMGRLETKYSSISWDTGSAESIRDFLGYVATDILIPLFVFIGIFFSLFAFYKLMTSDKEEDIAKNSKFLLRWVIGIMIMVSAGYLVDQLIDINDPGNETWGTIIAALIGDQDGGILASRLYENLFFPFLRMMLYIILGVMFIFALINALKLIFNTDEQNEKQVMTWLTFAVVGIIVILIAKSVVEIIYGQYSTVITQWSNLGDIGEWWFTDTQTRFEVIGTVINWILWLVTFVIVLIIIYQGYLLLTKPTDEETMKKLQNNLGYIFIGILIIGAAYLLANFLIFQTS